MSIRQLANHFDISTRSLRFYEERGLLSPQRRRGHRFYSQYDIERLKLILMGKRIGLTIAEICEILALHDRGEPKAEVLDFIVEKLLEQAEFLRQQEQAVREALAELERTRLAAVQLKKGPHHEPHVAQSRSGHTQKPRASAAPSPARRAAG